MEIQTKNITIEYAKQLLDGHVNKRPLSERMVNEMVSDIIDGSYSPKNAYIAIDSNGKLIYGQHILNAIIKSNKQVDVNVVELAVGEKTPLGGFNINSKYKY